VQILGGFLAQEMVDPVHLLLIQHRMDDPVQLAETRPRGTERLLVHHAGPPGEPVLAQRLGQPRESHRRDSQVADELRGTTQRLVGPAQHVEQGAGVVGAEPAAGEEHPLGKGVPFPRLWLGTEFGERVVDVGAEPLVRYIAAAVAHQPPLPG